MRRNTFNTVGKAGRMILGLRGCCVVRMGVGVLGLYLVCQLVC